MLIVQQKEPKKLCMQREMCTWEYIALLVAEFLKNILYLVKVLLQI